MGLLCVELHRSSFSIMSTKRNLNRPRHCRSGVSDSDAHSLEGADILHRVTVTLTRTQMD
jgi:hypothetical protein